jgi:hypothetical protein
MKTHINRLLALTLCAVGLANALPTAEEYPEVIPGPGLPSLASLNLTSAELYQRVPSPGKRSSFLKVNEVLIGNKISERDSSVGSISFATKFRNVQSATLRHASTFLMDWDIKPALFQILTSLGVHFALQVDVTGLEPISRREGGLFLHFGAYYQPTRRYFH